MPLCFVTATGTEVGKTLVTAALAQQLRAQGRGVGALKPLLTGYADAECAESDAGVLLQALGRPATPTAVAEIAPWRFTQPLSPDMAAAREGRSLSLDEICAFCRAADAGGTVLVEGIGGVMVPIAEKCTVLDWIAALGAPTLLVAGSYLGTLSHTLTALAAMAGRGVPPVGLVFSESPESPVPLAETAAAVARYHPELRIVCVPRLPGARPWERAPDLLGLLPAGE
jgi:dethiobiotin synthetase